MLEDGEVLIESGAILDHLDGLVEPERALIARAGPMRREVLRLCALATGLCDKMVSLIYERALHDATSAAWIERCETQVAAALDALERDFAGGVGPTGERLSHADVVTTCAMRFLGEAHGSLVDRERWPGLTLHADRCEAMSPFRDVAQVFIPPA